MRSREGRTAARVSWGVCGLRAGIVGLSIAALWGGPGIGNADAEGAAEVSSGSLVIIGGAERQHNTVIWSTIVELAGGKDASIAVLPTASDQPDRAGREIVEVLNAAGARAFVVPLTVGREADDRKVARDPDLAERVRHATGVFFVGGDQRRLRQALVDERGRNTPLLDAVWTTYRRGGVIAGTSAGAAVMSRVMFRQGGSLSCLTRGAALDKELDRGFGFLDREWLVDQHMLARGRFARALVAMHTQGIHHGIGVEEDTAVVVRGDQAHVIGYRGALVMDLSQAKAFLDSAGFHVQNARLSYIDHGGTIDFHTLKVAPAPEDLASRGIDPDGTGFRPLYQQRVFCNDILGPMAVFDVMYHLLENAHDEAIGLAFDGEAARSGPTRGFEFRFYRQADTEGWDTGDLGGDDYTVVNIHCDIRPVQISLRIAPAEGTPAKPAGR